MFHLLMMMQRIGGEVFYAPLGLRIRPGKYREPDLLLLRSAADPRPGNDYWSGADLVVEIVSPDDPERNMVLSTSFIRFSNFGGFNRIVGKK